MADAMVEQRTTSRFFCHRCNIEFEDNLQEYRCPFCSTGFIEQLENDREAAVLSSDDFSDADMSNIEDMSNLDDSDDVQVTNSPPHVLNDFSLLMSGGRMRSAARRETLMEHLVWMIGGTRSGNATLAAAGAVPAGAVTAGAPFLLVGAPGDYVFGGEGLDAVVTQLLGQLDNAGPPPLPREHIANLSSEEITEAQVTENTACSICWENFQIGEVVSRLECDHMFHSTCITPWLQLHATCPICRRSLLRNEQGELAPGAQPGDSASPASQGDSTEFPGRFPVPTSTFSIPALWTRLLMRDGQRSRTPGPATHWNSPGDTSSSSGSASTGSSVTGSNSTASVESNDREPQYNMDIDYD